MGLARPAAMPPCPAAFSAASFAASLALLCCVQLGGLCRRFCGQCLPQLVPPNLLPNTYSLAGRLLCLLPPCSLPSLSACCPLLLPLSMLPPFTRVQLGGLCRRLRGHRSACPNLVLPTCCPSHTPSPAAFFASSLHAPSLHSQPAAHLCFLLPCFLLSRACSWEGFAGGFVGTVVFAYFASRAMAQFQWMICPRKVLQRSGRFCG